MSYIDVLNKAEDQVTPGMSACQGCGGELVLRTVLKIAGENTIVGIPPGCMAGAGVVGWNYANGLKIPVHIPLLDNTASFLTGLSQIYERKGRADVNIVAVAGDGATADCGFQSLSASAERNEKMLYVCYDNEGYMNTGYQRSSTTTKGSRTSTTPIGTVINGKTPVLHMGCRTVNPYRLQLLVWSFFHAFNGARYRFHYCGGLSRLWLRCICLSLGTFCFCIHGAAADPDHRCRANCCYAKIVSSQCNHSFNHGFPPVTF